MLKMRHGVRSILCGPLTVKGVANEYARRSRSVSSHHTMPYGRSPALGARGRHTPGDRHERSAAASAKLAVSDGATEKERRGSREHSRARAGREPLRDCGAVAEAERRAA